MQQHNNPHICATATSLYGLAEYCQVGALYDDLIRDRIVVGIRDVRLSEKLQLDHQLTLEKAITSVRQSELIKEQQKTLRSKAPLDVMSEPKREVGAVNKIKRKQPTKYTHTTHPKTNSAGVTRGSGSGNSVVDADAHLHTVEPTVQQVRQNVLSVVK